MFIKRLIMIFFTLVAVDSWAQEGGSSVPESRIKPVFPAESSALVFIEGEDAVSTNFSNQPVSNFGCSGYRSVQLNRATGLQGGAAFYAEFVFYIEQAGDYEFWYGGTPPGPEDELEPSYSSPFTVIVDGEDPIDIYREDIHVIEGYTPSYYWNKCSTFRLSEGSHRLRIEVSKKRIYDGRYYFYLDNLFFLDRTREDELQEVRPSVFPSKLDSTDIDTPFASVSAYESYIERHPEEKAAYIDLSLVYSLIGDYQSALRVLNRAMALDSSDPYPIVLAAKNRLWKGDVRESLSLYDRALSVNPEDRVLWAEAGKVAAWSSEYDKSIDFFRRGLEKFPDDLTLQVNLGLTYLWMARNEEARESFDSAMSSASSSPEQLSRLGAIEEAAGYPDYAREVYLESIELYPAYLEFYLLLQSSYLASGNRAAADEIAGRIETVFIPSGRLESELDKYRKKLSLKDEVINSYLDQLKTDPGNLELRRELAQTYFWNGMSTEAIEQIKYVITTHAYRSSDSFGARNSGTLALSDTVASLVPFLSRFRGYSADYRKRLNTAFTGLERARKAVESKKDGKPEELAEARAALRSAEQEAADASADAVFLVELFDRFADDVESIGEQVKVLLSDEKTENDAFRSVVASSGWEWDRSWQISELYSIYENERELASYMLSRVLSSEERYDEASGVLLPEKETGSVEILKAGEADSVAGEDGTELPAEELDFSGLDTALLYTLYEALLMDGDRDYSDLSGDTPSPGLRQEIVLAEGDRLLAAYPHIGGVEHNLLAASYPSADAPAGIYYEGLGTEAVQTAADLSDREKKVDQLLKTVDSLQKQIAAVLTNRLERANYYLEADTYLIRYELGDYYLDEGMNREASEQFRRVIAVDPWNISAAYKLGVVEQRYGNWSEAMKYYRKVYQQDPQYENAEAYYNQLARMHADRVSGSFQLINTPSEISLKGILGYNTEFNSLIGMGVMYTLDQQRLYREYSGQEKGYFQLHLLEAELPINIADPGLKIVPHGGLYVESIYYKTDYYFPSDSTVGFLEFINTLSTFPSYGISAEWRRDFLTLKAGWENAIEEDTLYPDRSLVRKNDIELSADTWFNLDEEEYLGPLTTRTYGRIQFMDDGNFKGQAYQDVMLGIMLLENPVIKLSPSVSVNFESSKTGSVTDYYAPVGVLEAKAGLRSAFTFPSEDWSRALEAVVWAASGGYWSNLGSSSVSGSLKVEGGIGATFVKNSNMYYLNSSVMGTFSESGNEYWEIGLTLGVSLVLPDLLTN